MTDETQPELFPNLSAAQRARVEALRAARSVLVAKGPLSSGSATSADLIEIARFVEEGAR